MPAVLRILIDTAWSKTRGYLGHAPIGANDCGQCHAGVTQPHEMQAANLPRRAPKQVGKLPLGASEEINSIHVAFEVKIFG